MICEGGVVGADCFFPFLVCVLWVQPPHLSCVRLVWSSYMGLCILVRPVLPVLLYLLYQQASGGCVGMHGCGHPVLR